MKHLTLKILSTLPAAVEGTVLAFAYSFRTGNP